MTFENKVDWNHVYVAETPAPYMRFSTDREYVAPEYATRYIRPLLQKLYADLQRPVNVMDLGASYGIVPTLILQDITWQTLIDFYSQANERSWQEILNFYQQSIHDDKYKFYLVDSSQPAMQFAEQVGLCEKAFTFDLKHDFLSEELKNAIQEVDIFISSAALAYMKDNFFQQMFAAISQASRRPLVAISTYPLFFYDYMDSFETIFSEHDYSFICCKNPGIARRATPEEHAAILQEGKYKQHSMCKFEEAGYYTNAFYLASHKSKEDEFSLWIEELET